MHSHLGSLQAVPSSAALTCWSRVSYLETLNEDPVEAAQLIHYFGVWGSSPAFLSNFWVLSDAPPPPPRAAIILLQLSFIERQTLKREEVNRYICGCKLVHKYNFLEGLYAAVVLTLVTLSSYDVQPQSCIQVSTKGPPEAPGWSLQRERKCPHALGPSSSGRLERR